MKAGKQLRRARERPGYELAGAALAYDPQPLLTGTPQIMYSSVSPPATYTAASSVTNI